MLAFHVKKILKNAIQAAWAERITKKNQFFANLEKTIFHTSAQLFPNFRKGRALKICW